MEILTLEMLHTYLRIDFESKDEEECMMKAANKAEEKVQELLKKTFSDIRQEYGEIPAQIWHACLLLTPHYYEHTDYDFAQVPFETGIVVGPFADWVSIAELRRNVNGKNVSDDVLRMYQHAAINLTTKMLNRTTGNILSEYDGIPRKLQDAIIIAVKTMIKMNEPLSETEDYLKMPYEYDELCQPYVKM